MDEQTSTIAVSNFILEEITRIIKYLGLRNFAAYHKLILDNSFIKEPAHTQAN